MIMQIILHAGVGGGANFFWLAVILPKASRRLASPVPSGGNLTRTTDPNRNSPPESITAAVRAIGIPAMTSCNGLR